MPVASQHDGFERCGCTIYSDGNDDCGKRACATFQWSALGVATRILAAANRCDHFVLVVHCFCSEPGKCDSTSAIGLAPRVCGSGARLCVGILGLRRRHFGGNHASQSFHSGWNFNDHHHRNTGSAGWKAICATDNSTHFDGELNGSSHSSSRAGPPRSIRNNGVTQWALRVLFAGFSDVLG